jgi:hypothetical protein
MLSQWTDTSFIWRVRYFLIDLREDWIFLLSFALTLILMIEVNLSWSHFLATSFNAQSIMTMISSKACIVKQRCTSGQGCRHIRLGSLFHGMSVCYSLEALRGNRP